MDLKLRGWKVDETRSISCPIAGFLLSDVEISSYTVLQRVCLVNKHSPYRTMFQIKFKCLNEVYIMSFVQGF
jgi:hypothetical protein